MRSPLLIAAPLLAIVIFMLAVESASPKLKRSNGKRWDRLSEVVKAEIRASNQAFLSERGLKGKFVLRIEVDLLFIGFASDGGFGYDLRSTLVHELLTSMYSTDSICPSIWETAQTSAVCFEPTFVILTPPSQSIDHVESLIREYMRPDGRRSNQNTSKVSALDQDDLYKVEASGDFEDGLFSLLEESYMIDGMPSRGERLSEHRLALIMVNPDKRRLVPSGSYKNDAALTEQKVLDSWRRGLQGAGEAALLAHEAGFTYRYSYGGSGASASWLSRHHFVFIDISSGPVSYGPSQIASDAWIHSPQIPRLLPMFLSMEEELGEVGFGTMRSRLVEAAEEASSKVFAGSLAEVIHSATLHLFIPDLQFKRLEHARQVILPIIVLHDMDEDELSKTPIDQQVDVVSLQVLADSLMDPTQVALIEVSDTKRLHSHPQIIAALHKSQVSRSEPVMMDAKGWKGPQKAHHTHIDSGSLLRSLLSSLSDLTDESFVNVDPDSDVEEERELSQHARHHGSRIFPIFLLQLSSSSVGNSHMTTEDRQLFAANHDGAFVLQMVGSRGSGGQPSSFFSGFAVEGQSLFINSSHHVTSNIAATILAGLTGTVPPQERRVNGVKIQDWRWAMGANPFGPYSHSVEVSGVFRAAARRNFFISHIESSLSAITRRLKRLDALYLSGGRKQALSPLSDPFAFLLNEDDLNRSVTTSFQSSLLDEMLAGHFGPNKSEALLGDSSTIVLIKTMLRDIEEKLDELSFSLYSLSFDSARDVLVGLLALVDRFVKVMDAKLDVAEDLASCCSLRFQSHHPREGRKSAYIILGLALLLAISLLSIACCARKRPLTQLVTTNSSFSRSKGQIKRPSSSTHSSSPSKLVEKSSGSIFNWLGEKPEELPTFTKSSNSTGDNRLQRMFSNH